MKKNIVILIILTFSINCCYSQNNNSMPQSKSSEIYMKDRQEKDYGYFNLFVVEIIDTLATDFSYLIKFHKDEITSVKKYTKNLYTNQVTQDSFKLQNNSVLFHGGLFYNAQEFKKQHKQPASLYSLIHPNFLDLTNEEKIKILDSKVATRADTEQRK